MHTLESSSLVRLCCYLQWCFVLVYSDCCHYCTRFQYYCC